MSCNDQEKENIIVAGVRDESLHRRHFMNDHDKENLISASRAAVHVDMGIQYVTEVVASDVSTSKFSSFKLSLTNHRLCPDCTTVS